MLRRLGLPSYLYPQHEKYSDKSWPKERESKSQKHARSFVHLPTGEQIAKEISRDRSRGGFGLGQSPSPSAFHGKPLWAFNSICNVFFVNYCCLPSGGSCSNGNFLYFHSCWWGNRQLFSTGGFQLRKCQF